MATKICRAGVPTEFTDDGVAEIVRKAIHNNGTVYLSDIDSIPDRDCKGCGACCTVFSAIEVTKEDEKRFAEINGDPVITFERLTREHGPKKSIFLESVELVCPAFRGFGKGCGMYSHRMDACRSFEPGEHGCKFVRIVLWSAGALQKGEIRREQLPGTVRQASENILTYRSE